MKESVGGKLFPNTETTASTADSRLLCGEVEVAGTETVLDSGDTAETGDKLLKKKQYNCFRASPG